MLILDECNWLKCRRLVHCRAQTVCNVREIFLHYYTAQSKMPKGRYCFNQNRLPGFPVTLLALLTHFHPTWWALQIDAVYLGNINLPRHSDSLRRANGSVIPRHHGTRTGRWTNLLVSTETVIHVGL